MTDTVIAEDTVHTRLERSPSGTLSTRNLSRVLYVLHATSYNGVLYVKTGRVVTSFPVVQGEVGCCVGDPKRQRLLLLSRFGHNDAAFELVGSRSGTGVSTFVGFGDSRELILEGILRYTPYAELLWGLGFWSRHYPVPTQHLTGWGRQLDHGSVQRVLSSFCNGHCTMKMLLGGAPHELLPVLRALYYGLQTDLIHMSEVPRSRPVVLEYDNLRGGGTPASAGAERRCRSRALVFPEGPSTRPVTPAATPRVARGERVR